MDTAHSSLFIEIKSHWRKGTAGKQLRDFGFVMAIAIALVGLFPVLRHGPFRLWTVPIVAFFMLGALFLPRVLSPLYRIWMSFGAVMGYLNLRLILGVVFFVIVTPIAVLLRLLKKDILGLKLHKDWKTYRKPSDKQAAFEKQF